MKIATAITGIAGIAGICFSAAVLFWLKSE